MIFLRVLVAYCRDFCLLQKSTYHCHADQSKVTTLVMTITALVKFNSL